MLVEQFVRQHTRLKSTPLLPELRLHLGADPTPLWNATQAFALKNGLLRRKSMDPPYWAYAWAGGQALARWVLDRKTPFQRVLDVASGGGVVGVAAALAGAKRVVCADLDPMAEHVARLNARENGVEVEAVTHDATRLDTAAFDVVFAGDVFYEASMTSGLFPWLVAEAKAGRQVIAADPGRKYAPKTHATELARYLVKTPVVLEGRPSREALVYRIE